MLFAPLEGWRRVDADWAQVVRKLVDEDHKDRIVLMDNPCLSVIVGGRGAGIAERLEIHYTPRSVGHAWTAGFQTKGS